MKDISFSPPPDDPLDRAADALRRAAVPDGPSEEILARTLTALGAAAEAKTVPFYRSKPMRYVRNIAIAGSIAAGVAIFFAVLLPRRAPLAFAEVAATLRDARTLSFRITYKYAKKNETMRMKQFLKEPGLMRSEGEGQIGISDHQQHKSLILNTTEKTAMLIEYKRDKNVKKDVQENAVEELRTLAEKKGESVGKKRIGEIDAEGFRVEREGFPLTVWADPKTKIPVLVEMSISFGDDVIHMTLNDFQIDPKLDDSLFRLEPPEGYKLRKMEIEQDTPEVCVVRMLRAYTDIFDGKLPTSLRLVSADWQSYMKKRWGEKKPKGEPPSELIQFMQRAAEVEMLFRSKKEAGYKPEGVQFGDRDKIVFWYRPDRSTTYRAVFGDLHIADVKAEQLPAKAKK